jgi:hypothetical protein
MYRRKNVASNQSKLVSTRFLRHVLHAMRHVRTWGNSFTRLPSLKQNPP